MHNGLKRRLIAKVLGVKKVVNPIDVLWKMIDEENEKEEPDCANIEAWEAAIKRISDEVNKVEVM